MIGSMQREWPDVSCPGKDGVDFWRHQWDKHGTCTGASHKYYFETIIELKEQINITRILKEAGINLDNS